MRQYLFNMAFIAIHFSEPLYAADIGSLKKECAELGFKINSIANSDCALKLLKIANQHDEIESSRRVDAEQQARQEQLYRQQQYEQAELQRRAVAAQEEVAKAQSNAAFNNMLFNGYQMMNGTGPYSKPRSSVTCTSFMNSTTCQ